jgi:hypothetical protein
MTAPAITQAIADLEAAAALLTRAADAIDLTHADAANANRETAAELHVRALRFRLASKRLTTATAREL